MVVKASAPGNDRAKTEKCRCKWSQNTMVILWVKLNINHIDAEKDTKNR